jgi:hypothetical protein
MKATMTITDCDDASNLSFECTATVYSVKSSGYGSSAYLAGGAILGSVTTIMALFFVRKRRIGTINLLQEEHKQSEGGNFEMMSDSVRV